MEEEILLLEEEKEHIWVTGPEMKIIKASIEGKTSKEIGEDVGLSARTIEMRRSNLLKRFRCRNMAQLVARLFREKILS